MAFRVELSAQAQSDVAAIYDWLTSQEAGETGERLPSKAISYKCFTSGTAVAGRFPSRDWFVG